MKHLKDLNEREILALAITSEEEDSQIYMNFANRLRTDYPATADMFVAMAKQEQGHKNQLIDLYTRRFGEHIPYITRQDVQGFMRRAPIWLMDKLRIDAVRRQAEMMEIQASNFYKEALKKVEDTEARKLLGDLIMAEEEHAQNALEIEQQKLGTGGHETEEQVARKMFLLQIVQPGLTGLIDGSVSTLAPIFAAAFATHTPHDALVVGLAASLGSGISMGITEGMADDGALTGRGHPWLRGAVCGAMTTVGGLGHTLPYLISDFWTATAVAAVVVALELIAISWIRWKYMETPFVSAIMQVILGGVLVLMTGILIGGA